MQITTKSSYECLTREGIQPVQWSGERNGNCHEKFTRRITNRMIRSIERHNTVTPSAEEREKGKVVVVIGRNETLGESSP